MWIKSYLSGDLVGFVECNSVSFYLRMMEPNCLVILTLFLEIL